MRYDPERHHRRSLRLKGYDYCQPGAYFVTICTRQRLCLFGEVVNGQVRLNAYGEIVRRCWENIPNHFAHVALDAFVVMPNHVHGILVIVCDPDEMPNNATPHHGAVQRRTEQFGKPVPGSIPTVVRSFKSATTKLINELRGTPGCPVWQRNYYERVIRNERMLNQLREYIATNPLRWATDWENPSFGRSVSVDQARKP